MRGEMLSPATETLNKALNGFPSKPMLLMSASSPQSQNTPSSWCLFFSEKKWGGGGGGRDTECERLQDTLLKR